MLLPNYRKPTQVLNIFTAAAIIMGALLFFAHLAHAKSYNSSQDFVQKASIGGEFEIESSRLALDRSQNADIQQFAQKMVDDHTAVSDKLNDLLPQTSVDKADIKEGLDPAHQKMFDKLQKASDANFDKEYVKAQRKAHKEAIDLFSDYAKSGDDAQLKNFAAQTLPTLKEHRQMVKNLKP